MLDFAGAVITQNDMDNPHGHGKLVYAGIASINDSSVDLVITPITQYTPHPKMKSNGKHGKLASINLKSGSRTKFKFEFMKANGQAVELQQFYLSFYDIDHKNGTSVESISVSGHAEYYRTNSDSIKVTEEGDVTTFTASGEGSGRDNPKNPDKLTTAERGKSVTVLYTSKSSIEITFATDDGRSGRNFFVSGKSVIPC